MAWHKIPFFFPPQLRLLLILVNSKIYSLKVHFIRLFALAQHSFHLEHGTLISWQGSIWAEEDTLVDVHSDGIHLWTSHLINPIPNLA